MMTRTAFRPWVIGFIALVWSASATAANLTGAWTLVLDPDFSGNPNELDCDFSQKGEELTADCGDGPSITGTVQGRTVKFVIMTGQNGLLPARFSGELDQREKLISGTWTLADTTGNRNGRFRVEKK